jgi:large subunit ribosomal protein L13
MNRDATNLILGRMASFAAKKALLGETVNIVNCEKAIVTGNKKTLLLQFKRKRDMGIPSKGPFFPRSPERIVKRTIRGMLPYKQEKGMKAFKRIKCYTGVPENIKNAETIKEADISKVPNLKYLKLEQISKYLGGK